MNIMELAAWCKEIVRRAQEDLGKDLCGYSALDLVADQISDASLTDLEVALVVAGIPHHLNK